MIYKVAIETNQAEGMAASSWTTCIETLSNGEACNVNTLRVRIDSASSERLALQAAVATLALIPRSARADIYITSVHVIDGTANKDERDGSNSDLWTTLDLLCDVMDIRWNLLKSAEVTRLQSSVSNLEQVVNYPIEGKSIFAYTDGSCLNNPGPGGWASILEVWMDGKIECRFEGWGFEESTTNNRMELMGAINALKHLPHQQSVTIHADSRYLIDGMTKWIHGWKQKNWRLSTKKAVANMDLWKELDTLCQNRAIKWNWVRGHSSNEGNNRADELAVAAAKKLI